MNTRADQRPNIIFVFADDWGYGDLGCQGHPELQTPHLDHMAAQGTRFTEFHVTSPVCSPSRCSVITGHYPARHLLHGHLARYDLNGKRHMPNWLDVNVHALPRLMQQAGYRTAHYGKWHLGGGGGINGHPDAPAVKAYGYDDTRTWNGNGPTWYGTDKWPFTLENDYDEVWSANCCGSAVDETIAFIQNGADAEDVDLSKPFYINLWIKDPHTPLNPTAEQREPYAHLPEPQQTYYSVLTHADRQIGRLLQFLDDAGLAEDTLVIFSSDNGPEAIREEWGTAGSTGGLRGRKRSLFEGGVRTPFIARWPGRIPAGRLDATALLSAVDLMPTFLRLAEATPPPDWRPDGVDIAAALTGKPFERPCPLMWEWRARNPHDEEHWPMLAIREGDYQLLADPGTPATPPRAELYHMPSDPFQRQDIAAHHPDLVARLQRQLDAWNGALPGYATRFGARVGEEPRHTGEEELAPATELGLEQRFVDIGGRPLSCLFRSGDPLLVLLPGSHQDYRQYVEVVRALGPGTGILIVEFPGHRASRVLPADPSVERFAEDVLAAVETVAPSRWYLGGHSLGGMVALEIGRRKPPGLRGIIAIEGWTDAEAAKAFGGGACMYCTLSPEQVAEQDRLRALATGHRTEAERKTLSGLWQRWSGEAFLRATDLPILELWGDRNRPRPTSEQMRVPDRPNITVQWFAGASHNLPLERPVEVAQAIEAWIENEALQCI